MDAQKEKNIFFIPPWTKINSRKTPWKPWHALHLTPNRNPETVRLLPGLFYPVGLSLPVPSSRDLSTEHLVGGGNPQGRPGGHAQEGEHQEGSPPGVGEGKATWEQSVRDERSRAEVLGQEPWREGPRVVTSLGRCSEVGRIRS